MYHLMFFAAAFAHGGGLDASGCHHQRSTGDYHCHRPSAYSAPAARPRRSTPAHPVAAVHTTFKEPAPAKHQAPPLHPAVPHGERHGCRYTVAAGDTLTDVAAAHQVTVDDLVHWNHLDNPEVIEVGDELFLTADCADAVAQPVVAATPTPTPAPTPAPVMEPLSETGLAGAVFVALLVLASVGWLLSKALDEAPEVSARRRHVEAERRARKEELRLEGHSLFERFDALRASMLTEAAAEGACSVVPGKPTRRPLNGCSRCLATWYPRGADRSSMCKECGEDAVVFVADPAQLAELHRRSKTVDEARRRYDEA